MPPIVNKWGVASTFPMLKGSTTSHKANVMGEETTKTSLICQRAPHVQDSLDTAHLTVLKSCVVQMTTNTMTTLCEKGEWCGCRVCSLRDVLHLLALSEAQKMD